MNTSLLNKLLPSIQDGLFLFENKKNAYGWDSFKFYTKRCFQLFSANSSKEKQVVKKKLTPRNGRFVEGEQRQSYTSE
jgi:hypothetical protein